MENIHTVKELSEIWLIFKENAIKETTRMQYKRIINNYINVYLGDVLLTDLTIVEVLKFIEKIDNGISQKTKQDIVVVLKSILNYGNLLEKCHIPLPAIPSIKINKQEVKVLSSNDIDILQNYLKNHINDKNLGLLVCLYTGIRLGEICALAWENIFLNEKKILINKTVYRVTINGKSIKKIGIPKTQQSIREIPINDELLFYLQNNKKSKGYLITGEDYFLDTRTFQYYFKKVLKELNINHYHFHCLRHTFATKCIQCEVDIKSLSEILGHSSVNITLNNYVHSSFMIKQKQMNKFRL